MFPQVREQAHQQPAAADREDERAAAGQVTQDLGRDRPVAVGPERVEVRVDEVAAALGGQLGGVAEQVAAPAGDLHQLDAERPQLLVLRAGDGLRYDAGHGEAERPGRGRRAEGRVPHRRDDELPGAALSGEVFEQVRRPRES